MYGARRRCATIANSTLSHIGEVDVMEPVPYAADGFVRKIAMSTPSQTWVLSHGGNIQRISPGQVRVSILQLCILVTVSQLTLHASVATFVLRVLFRRTLAPILIFGLLRECVFAISFGSLSPQIHTGADARNGGRVTIAARRNRFCVHEWKIRCHELRVTKANSATRNAHPESPARVTTTAH